MKTLSWLAALATVVAVTGGCMQTTPAPAPVSQPIVATPPPTIPPPLVTTEPPAAEIIVPPPPTVTVPPPAAVPVTTSTSVSTAAASTERKPVQVKPAVATPPAAKPQAAGGATPKIVTYPASFGKVSFNHQQHALSNACNACHPTAPPGKVALGKDKAHQLCKGCHQKKGAPSACTACHKKG